MALTLYKRIISIYPDLATGPDKWENIVLEDDGSGAKIKTWSHSSLTEPTQSQLDAVTE
jgi:hypothetical protein